MSARRAGLVGLFVVLSLSGAGIWAWKGVSIDAKAGAEAPAPRAQAPVVQAPVGLSVTVIDAAPEVGATILPVGVATMEPAPNVSVAVGAGTAPPSPRLPAAIPNVETQPSTAPPATSPVALLPAASTPPPETAFVEFSGASSVWLDGPVRRQAGAAFPPGVYTVHAVFDGLDHTVDVGTISLAAGDGRTVRCNAELLQCRVK